MARVREAAAIDARLAEAREVLETGIVYLREAARSLRDDRGRIGFNPERLEAIEARLQEIEQRKRRDGGSTAEILAPLDRARADLAALGQSEARLTDLAGLFGEALLDLTLQAQKLSNARRRLSRAMGGAIFPERTALGMAKAAFEIRVTSEPQHEDHLGPHGVDAVEFQISPNPGEALTPLHRIASGGERSRIMRAIRTILAGADDTPTLVFDEIDAGIGGRMAEGWAGSWVEPPAAIRSSSSRIYLRLPALRIITLSSPNIRIGIGPRAVEVLDEAGRGQELGRMLGGPSRSRTGLQHAIELLGAANHLKKRMRAVRSE